MRFHSLRLTSVLSSLARGMGGLLPVKSGNNTVINLIILDGNITRALPILLHWPGKSYQPGSLLVDGESPMVEAGVAMLIVVPNLPRITPSKHDNYSVPGMVQLARSGDNFVQYVRDKDISIV